MSTPAPLPDAAGVTLRLEDLSFDYGDGQVLRFPDCTVPRGQHCLILGPSGCGKSTLLHLIAGLLPPTGGQITLAGTPLAGLRGAALDRFRGQHVGLVFQRLHLLPALTVRENLLLAQSLAGLSAEPSRVEGLLERLGVVHRAGARPEALSFGQAQRVAIARAVINSPTVILADEPTSNLDDANTAEVLGLLRQEAERTGASLVVATHDRRIREAFDQRLELAP